MNQGSAFCYECMTNTFGYRPHHYSRQNLRLEFGGVAKKRHIGHRWEVRPKPRPETHTLHWQAFHFSQHGQL